MGSVHHFLFVSVNPFSIPGLNNEEYQVVIANDTTHYIIDDLEPASNYTFYIVAYMPMGASQMSDHVTQHTLEDGKMPIISGWYPLCPRKNRVVVQNQLLYFTPRK